MLALRKVFFFLKGKIKCLCIGRIDSIKRKILMQENVGELLKQCLLMRGEGI